MFNQISVSNNQAVDSHPTLSTQKSGKEELGGPASKACGYAGLLRQMDWEEQSLLASFLGRIVVRRARKSALPITGKLLKFCSTENMRTVATADPECKCISHIF